MTTLEFDRLGAGPPLVLLHGLGSSRRAWDPLVPMLTGPFEVIAVDLPGFGGSASLPAGVEPSPSALAGAVADLLDELGIDRPQVVGNSLGGWVALELAKIRPVSALTLLSPAGLWRDRTPTYARVSLRVSKWLADHAGALLGRLVCYRPGRLVILGQSHGRPLRLTAERARLAIRSLRSGPGFDATLAATTHRRYRGGATLEAPITVAFGSRDLILLRRQSRHLDQLPPGVRTLELAGCGHIPMSDDPEAVVALIMTVTGVADGRVCPGPRSDLVTASLTTRSRRVECRVRPGSRWPDE
jgi:pimeloyl-ACP methyl ester carboxylesterase